jgi:hypothetical protein
VKKNKILLLLPLLLLSVFAFAQKDTEILLHFKVVADSAFVGGINVMNLVNEKTTITDANGEFTILGKVDDLLILSAVNFEYRRKMIDEEDLKKDVIIIIMVSKVFQLEEVTVNEYGNITSASLGIVPKDQKVYTAAERKVFTAQSGPVDMLVNLISGRTKDLKKQLAISKKEILLDKMEFLYDDKYYVETLKIPQEHIRGFQYYIVEDAAFATALKSKNKTYTMFLAAALAVKYNALIKTE